MTMGVREGMGPGGIVRELRGLQEGGKGVFSRYQAERIARTETRFAQTAGRIEGWQQSGVVSGKEFLLAPEACVYCASVARQYKGKSVPLGQPLFTKGDTITPVGGGRDMKVDYSDLQGPPIHPNCRCNLIPTILKG